jgi:peptide/nickel transport system substrate-binding protein
MKTQRIALLLVSAAILATSTALTATSLAAPAAEKTLTVVVANLGAETFIPRLNQGFENPAVFAWGETLLRVDSVTRDVEANIVSKWTNAKQGTDYVWRFQIRRGVRFNEGKGNVTSADVRFLFRQCLLADALSTACPILKNAVDGDIANFKANGPYAFTLRSAQATPNLPLFLSNGVGIPLPVIPSAYYSKVGDKGFAEHPIGAGPFVFVSRERGKRVTLKAVKNHFRATPTFDGLEIVIAPEVSTRVSMLRSGSADLAEMDVTQKRQLQNANLKIWRIQDIGNLFVALGGQYYDDPAKNCTDCPWVGYTEKARKVREALSLAVNRKLILDRLLAGEGRLASVPFSWTPGKYAYNDPKWPTPTYNPTAAKRLLAEAGYPNGFTINYAIYQLYLSNLGDINEAVAADWETIGVTVKREAMQWPSFRQRMIDRTTRGYAWGIVTLLTNDPLADLYRLFSKAGAVSYLDDPQFDKVIVKAADTFGAAKRATLAREVGNYIIDQTLGIPMFSVNGIAGSTTRVQKWQLEIGDPVLGNFEYVKLAG